MVPTVGRIVIYKLSEQAATEINRRRTSGSSIAGRIKSSIVNPQGGDDIAAWPVGAQAHIGNNAEAGEVYPMLICRIWGSTPDSSVNGQVFLDGNDTFWATSVTCGNGLGNWSWPTINK